MLIVAHLSSTGSDDGDESDAEHLEDVVGKKKFELPKSEYEKRQDKVGIRLSPYPLQLCGDLIPNGLNYLAVAKGAYSCHGGGSAGRQTLAADG